MSPNWGPRKEVRLGRTGMSSRELRRVEVLARVQAEELKLIDAASLMGVSYRQAKRIGKRYREEGAEGMKHRSAGRRSSRAKPEKFRRQVLGLVRRKYSGEEGRRFGPTPEPANEISLLDSFKEILSNCCIDPLRPPA